MVHQASYRLRQIFSPQLPALKFGVVIMLCLGMLPLRGFSQTETLKWESFLQEKDFVNGRKFLGQALSENPAKVLLHMDDVEYMLLEWQAGDGREVAGKPQTDTLMKLYEIGIVSDLPNKGSWLARRAFLVTRFPANYKSKNVGFIQEAIEYSPLDCPLPLYALLFEEVLAAGASLPEKPISYWLKLDRFLYLRSLYRPEESEDCNRLEQQLSHRMMASLPNCDQVGKELKAKQHGGLNVEIVRSYLASSHLLGCADSLTWRVAVNWLEEKAKMTPEIARLLAENAMSNRQYAQAIGYWETALAEEEAPEMVAADLLFMAEIKKMEGQFREARSYCEQAIHQLPSWGEPYLRLADLYRDGAMQCRMSAFDHKALNWLLIDLCQTASTSDPSYQSEANRRILLYTQDLPTNDELKSRGLRQGDTWPLACWMGKTVLVRYR